MLVQALGFSAGLAVWAGGCQSSPDATAVDRPGDARAARRPAGEPVEGIRAALRVVPEGVLPADETSWTDAKIDVANEALAKDAVGRPITLRLTVGEVIRWKGGYALNGPTAESAGLAAVDFWIYFQPPSSLTAGRLNLGDEVTVTGALTAMRFDNKNRPRGTAHLYVEVDHAQLLDPKLAAR